MNTHESYVSLETAKLLKQAGFDWPVDCYYDIMDDLFDDSGFLFNENSYSYRKSAPTLSIVQRWLREVKGYSIYPTWGGFKIYVLDESCPGGYRKTITVNSNYSYEKSIEEGIKRSLIILETESSK